MSKLRILHVPVVVSVLLLVTALPLAAFPERQSTIHVVQAGEHLTAIANRYGTTPQAIASANNLVNMNLLYVGQRLTIPGSTSPAVQSNTYYVVDPGDTLSAIAASYGTTTQALVDANGLASANLIYVGQRLLIPGGGSAPAPSTPSTPSSTTGYYTVQAGDTVSSIAVRHGVTAWTIVNANHLANPNFIYVGQRLVIQGGSSPAPAPAPQPSGSNKRIVIDLSEQHMYVYQDGGLLWSWVTSTGMPGAATIPGNFQVLTKVPNAYAYTWGLQMPYWLGIYWAGSLQNGIHALPIMADGRILWDGYLGQPVSYGCIILSTENAQTLYNWADVGTPVDIQY
ncbi:MAG TPA: LysM peptidoglycan-binding domain-containing protein [Anaerolineae bacterium]|nr:LysM peptidoglycan-binding domain-containing protein [Anaerolineae bacterium]